MENISFNELDLDWGQMFLLELINKKLEKGEEVTDNLLESLIYPPQIVALVGIKKSLKKDIIQKEKAGKLLAIIKKEFYSLICDENSSYNKEKTTIKD